MSPYPPPTPYSASDYPNPTPFIDPDIDENGRDKKKIRRGNILLGVGAGLLGLGAIAAGVAAALVSNPGTQVGGWFVVTAAALLGAGGLACLIAGGIIRARA